MMLDSYIGQRDSLTPLIAAIAASRATGRPLPHSLFLGKPGTGKTELAKAVAKEMGGPCVILNAATVKESEAIAVAAEKAQGGTLFLDEIHALDRKQAEALFTLIDTATITLPRPVMGTQWQYVEITRAEDHPLSPDLFYGPGLYEAPVQVPTRQTEPEDIIVDDVTVIGATTDEAMLPPALLSRLSRLIVRLRPYTAVELALIASDYAEDHLDCRIEDGAAALLAARARQSPRRVKQLTERASDYAVVDGKVITKVHVEKALEAAGVDQYGLEAPHREMLRILVESGGVSRTSLAQRMGIPARNMELYWSDLNERGFVTIGRRHEVTDEGKKVLA